MDYSDWRLGPPQKAAIMAQALKQQAPPDTTSGYWQKTWDGAIEEPEMIVVDQSPWGTGVQGWTVCDKDKRKCQILMLRNADRQCVETHERQHVAGFDHPDYPRGYICPK